MAIEEQLQWGESSQWSSYDFDKLTELIFERTKMPVSSNTLKRVWGRIKYESKPSAATLNTLSQFQGYADFREFVTTRQARKAWGGKVIKKPSRIPWSVFRSRPTLVFVSGAVFMLILIVVLSNRSKTQKLNPDDFYFTSRAVTKGLPNTVIFEYRARNLPAGTKMEIQQSWDKRKRQTVSPKDSLATSIYYDPGYFMAKLVVQDQVVKEHGVLITSEGWKAKLESSEKTLYFNDSSITKLGKITIGPELLKRNGIDPDRTSFRTNFRYVNEFGDLRVNDLYLETRFRNIATNHQNICKKTSVTLLMEGEAIEIPLSKVGCVSELQLYHLDRSISGKNNDLSKFGVDIDEWTTLGCTFGNELLTVTINGAMVMELPMNGRINKMHGLSYRFEGMGEVKSLLLKNGKKIYYAWP